MSRRTNKNKRKKTDGLGKVLRIRTHISNMGDDGLASKVAIVSSGFPRDEKGYYIPFCSFNHHCGVALDIRVCEARRCPEYRKLYFIDAEIPYPRPSDLES